MVKVTGRPNSCSENRSPLASVSVSRTKPSATSRNRKRSSVSSGTVPSASGSASPRCSRFSSPATSNAMQRRHHEQRVGDQRDGDVQRWPTARPHRQSDARCRPRAAPARTRRRPAARRCRRPASFASTPDNPATSTVSSATSDSACGNDRSKPDGRDDRPAPPRSRAARAPARAALPTARARRHPTRCAATQRGRTGRRWPTYSRITGSLGRMARLPSGRARDVASLPDAGRGSRPPSSYWIRPMFENLTERLSRVVKDAARPGAPDRRQHRRRVARSAARVARSRRRAAGRPRFRRDRQGQGRSARRWSGSLTPGQALVGVVHRELTALMGGAGGSAVVRHAAARGHPAGGPAGLGQDDDDGQARPAVARPSRRKRCCWCPPTSIGRRRSSSCALLAAQVGVDFFPSDVAQAPVAIARKRRSTGRARHYHDVLIVDTAGRLGVDEAMMREIAELHAAVHADRDAVRRRCDAGPGRGQRRRRRSAMRCR